MSLIRAIQVELQGDNNETFYGTLTIESTLLVNDTNRNVTEDDAMQLKNLEADPVGASTYVIAVVLIYGLSIVFLIGSHVVLRGRENYRDVEKQIDKFLRQAPVIKEKNAKDNYKNLKHSIIPVVALSSARDLVSRRKSFAAFLVGLHPTPAGSRRSSHDQRASTSDDQGSSGISTVEEDATGRMPTIQEEESAEELDRSQNSYTTNANKAIKIESENNKTPSSERRRARFYLGDGSNNNQSHDSLQCPESSLTITPQTVKSKRLPEREAPAVSDAWLASQRADVPIDLAPETEHLLHVTCV